MTRPATVETKMASSCQPSGVTPAGTGMAKRTTSPKAMDTKKGTSLTGVSWGAAISLPFPSAVAAARGWTPAPGLQPSSRSLAKVPPKLWFFPVSSCLDAPLRVRIGRSRARRDLPPRGALEHTLGAVLFVKPLAVSILGKTIDASRRLKLILQRSWDF